MEAIQRYGEHITFKNEGFLCCFCSNFLSQQEQLEYAVYMTKLECKHYCFLIVAIGLPLLLAIGVSVAVLRVPDWACNEYVVSWCGGSIIVHPVYSLQLKNLL